MALAIDASSPAVVTQTNSATATLATASFTPPAGSLLVIGWSGNTGSASDPAAPSITDSLGAHLTYSLAGWKHRSVAPTVDGQAAMWWAVVGSSAAMTVTVTTGTGSGARQGALKVWVITGADTGGTPVSATASGAAGSASVAAIAQNYTASATSGWGFIGTCDWDALGTETAGTGMWSDGASTIAGIISYGFMRRTTADDSSGVTNTLRVTLPGTSTNTSWAYAEVLPAAAGGGSGSWLPTTPARRRTGVRPFRARVSTPVRAQVNPPYPVGAIVDPPRRLRGLLARRPRVATPAPPQVVVTAPAYPPAPERARLKGLRLFRPRTATPVPAQVILTAPPYPPAGLRTRIRGLRLFRGRQAAPVPQQTLPVAPVYLPQQDPRPRFRTRPVRGRIAAPPPAQLQPPLLTRARRKVARLWRGEVWTPVPPQVVFIAPPRAPQATRARRNQFAARRHRGGVEGWMVGGSHQCVITRPNTGTTTWNQATTARPDTGTTSAPC